MPLKVVTSGQMAEIDRITIEQRGIPALELMEAAGRSVADHLMERHHPGRVAVVCGKGNNAGDGFVVARLLTGRGVKVDVLLLSDPEDLSGDARVNFDRLGDLPVRIRRVDSPDELDETLSACDWIVDAILGTGLRGPARGLSADAIEAINTSGRPVMSVDIPSGLSGDGGALLGPVVRATETVTMGLPKLGMVLPPGVGFTGRVTVAPLDFPPDLLTSETITVNLLQVDDIRAWLPARDPAGHKGTFGKTMLIAGSFGMTGAALLASRAAVRSGVGLVYLALPERLAACLAPAIVEAVSVPIPGEKGLAFHPGSIPALEDRLSGVDSVGLGPGLGCTPETATFVLELIGRIPCPLVVDADALNALASAPARLSGRRAPTILTPHPGEMSRLTGLPIADVLADRLDVAGEFSRRWGAVVVLKGHCTIIAEPGGQRYINPTGNSGLAKGGSGDVLTGLIAGFLAQGMGALHAACTGVFVHGLCADLAAADIPPRALIPSDVIATLPHAFKHLGV